MKTIKYLKIALLATTLLLISCNNDNGTNNNNPDKTDDITIGTIQAKIDETLKVAKNFVTANYNSSINSIQISGSGGPNNNLLQFNLGIGNFTGVGTYNLGVYDSYGLGINAMYSEVSLGNYACTPQYTETTGQVTVSEFVENKIIKGTFHFKAKKQSTTGSGNDYINVTEGVFYISLE